MNRNTISVIICVIVVLAMVGTTVIAALSV